MALLPVMNTPMARWAKRGDRSDVIGTAVSHTQNVVWLKVRRSIVPEKRCSITTPFADSVSTSEDVVSHREASLIHTTTPLCRLPSWSRSICEGEGFQLGQ